MKDLRICILTIGTRGDVQPYIALGLGLKAAGYTVSIATLADFMPLIDDYGLQTAVLRGDYLSAAKNTGGEEKQARANPLRRIQEYLAMAKDTLDDEWASAQNADIFIYNPAAIGGYSIAEKLDVPSFAAFPAPLYSPTRAFPSPFFPISSLGPLNKLSHHLFAKMGPSLYRRAINAWRKDTLGLPPAKGEEWLNGKPVTKLYAYSEAVLSRPADWNESTVVTGYWFLDAPAGWQPDPGLDKFLQEGPPPVYVGFGSMAMNASERVTQIILEAVKLAGVRAVLALGAGKPAAGYSARDVFALDAAPHDWLFPQMAAVVHHGGAGTTGSALRAGRPAVVCPFVADQFFWGRRVESLGVGPAPVPQARLTAEKLAAAIKRALGDNDMRARAAALGEMLRAEDGVGRAVDVITSRIGP